MKKFILKLSIFTAVILGIVTIILGKYGGNVDYFYVKMTTPKATSLIIGDSRSFQGIQPQIIDQELKESGVELPMFNYSFTGAQAIAGPLYNESIYKKLDPNTTDGIFIISVLPDFVTSNDDYDNMNGEFREADQPPHNMKYVNTNPNFEYLFRNLSFFHFRGVFKKNTTTHKNGWLEESGITTDKLVRKSWKESQLKQFVNSRAKLKISDYRIKSLDTLVKELHKHGTVFLVRMPIVKAFSKLENEYYPSFDKKMDSLAVKNKISYINFTKASDSYDTYDGHHLTKIGGRFFTKALSDSIRIKLKRQY